MATQVVKQSGQRPETMCYVRPPPKQTATTSLDQENDMTMNIVNDKYNDFTPK